MKGTSGEQMGEPRNHGMDKAAPLPVPGCFPTRASTGCSTGRLGGSSLRPGADQKLLMASNRVINSSWIFQND